LRISGAGDICPVRIPVKNKQEGLENFIWLRFFLIIVNILLILDVAFNFLYIYNTLSIY